MIRKLLSISSCKVYITLTNCFFFLSNHATNLTRHLRLKHIVEYRQITIINESQNQAIVPSTKKTEHDKDTILKEKLINCCIKLVTVHGRPFELLEDEAFK